MNRLEVTDLHKSFDQVKAIQGVSFGVETGSFTALLGPSGCGKTTLLRIIAGFEQADRGTVTLGGAVVSGAGKPLAPERRSIGFVAQEGALFPHLSVRQNIQFGLPRRERQSGTRVAELLELVQLAPDVANRAPHELSGGQQQRVALARALARRPEIMLLDEPFASLDSQLRTSTRTLMARALRSEGITTLLVTHDREEALSMADQVVVLNHGQIRQTGGPRAVYGRPVDLWTARFLGDTVVLPADIDAGRAVTALGPVKIHSAVRAGAAAVMIRPEQLKVVRAFEDSHRDGRGLIEAISYRGPDLSLTIRLDSLRAAHVVAHVVADETRWEVGDAVQVEVVGAVSCFPPDVQDREVSGSLEAP